MNSFKKSESNSFALILICVLLISIAGIFGFSSKNIIPVEIDVYEPEKYSQTTELVTTTSSENLINVLKTTFDSAVGIIQEAPKFVFSFGSKLLSSIDERLSFESNALESNVYSVVENKSQ